jgi:hypothetical protein
MRAWLGREIKGNESKLNCAIIHRPKSLAEQYDPSPEFRAGFALNTALHFVAFFKNCRQDRVW